MARNVPEKVPFRWVCPRHGLKESFLEEGASELRPAGGMESTRERWKRVLQAEAAECAKAEKIKACSILGTKRHPGKRL